MKFIYISDVVSVYLIYPLIVLIFSVVYLKEKSWWLDYACCLASIIGVILVIRPEFIFHNQNRKENELFNLLVVLAACLKSGVDITTRIIGCDMHFQANNLIYSSIGILVFPFLNILIESQIPQFMYIEYFIFFLSGLFVWLYQTFQTLALQNEKAGRASMINYLQVNFIYIADIIFFDKPLMVLDLVGTLMIFSFNFGNGFYKTYSRLIKLEKHEVEKSNE
jgi:drug/metabolite transporter (DMT)-like permease